MTRALLLAVLFAAAPASATPLVVKLLSKVDGTKRAPDASEKLVVAGTTVTLFADVRGGPKLVDPSSPKFPSDCAQLRPTVASCSVRWTRIEAAQQSLSNTDPSFHWHEIAYEETPLAACDDRFTCPADVRATKLEDHGQLGTMAFRVHVTLGDRSGASTGPDQRHRGGLVPGIARVTIRRDDTYLGHLTELFNTPYIWGSAGTDAVHQAERRIGSDCADFVTYGVRRLGHTIPYTSTWQLGPYTRQLAAMAPPDADGLYRDAAGKVVTWGKDGARPGDLMLFRGHVGALVRDEAPLGMLSRSDVMIHTSWHEPTEQTLAESGYGDGPASLLRWKVLDRK